MSARTSHGHGPPPPAKKPKTLDYFFKKSDENDSPSADDQEAESSESILQLDETEAISCPTLSGTFENDIGRYTRASHPQPLSSAKKAELLTDPWRPGPDYKLPYSIRASKGEEQKRFLRQDHLDKYPFLAFSHQEQGLFCIKCVLFDATKTGLLVGKPLKKYESMFGAKGYVKSHSKSDSHDGSVKAAKHFLDSLANPEKKVCNRVTTSAKSAKAKQAEIAKGGLTSVASALVSLSRAGVALRGHRDDSVSVRAEIFSAV